ncbi:hypothetical protein QN277_025832 [Acacia crassicarpa]|uniref:Uncharacterized protein n=1 Tax=Acacia crassicarpa TaxID=499986 RepID=A0AAE1J8W2_9FABA|nr:hypothetical protein QN277_025832 [Acacia crassicarpa]
MALPISSMKSQCFSQICPHLKQPLLFSPASISFPTPNFNSNRVRVVICCAAKSQTEPVKKRSSSTGSTKKKKKKGKDGADDTRASDSSDFEIVDDFSIVEHGPSSSTSTSSSSSSSNTNASLTYHPTPLPKPPAGFIVDDQGKVLKASNKRLANLIDPTSNSPLECVIRRVFRSSQDDECMLLCPVDTPVLILKSTNGEGWSAVSDDEVESILPAAAFALAKINMYLVDSGFCYTARGGFCYSEEDIFDFHTDDGKEVDGVPTEGVEITWFNMDGAHYMIYTPSDPLLFVAVKDKNGMLQIADDELLDDPAIISAIDEETEFNALVEEEAALLDSLIGKR